MSSEDGVADRQCDVDEWHGVTPFTIVSIRNIVSCQLNVSLSIQEGALNERANGTEPIQLFRFFRVFDDTGGTN